MTSPTETSPLIPATARNSASNALSPAEAQGSAILSRRQLWGLYLSHFLSTWNARGYEFAAILFTASAYQDTLTASSIRGIATTLATLTLSSSVGRWADNHPSRLQALRTTIFFQRFCVVIACSGWLLIASDGYVEAKPQLLRVLDRDLELSGGSIGFTPNAVQKACVMAVIILLGIGERLSAVGNMMVMERDWVPTLATATSTPSLPTLNAGMRRIDLICKLVAPVFISAVALALQSIKLTAIMIAAINAASVPVEWVAAYRVWKTNARLRAHRPPPVESADNTPGSNDGTPGGLREKIHRWGRGLIFFFSSDVWIPSISLALLHFSVLSFSASMITYLLAANFQLSVITIARTCSTLVELSATVIMPFGVKVMENRHLWKQRRATSDAPSNTSELSPSAVERMGLWGLWAQLTCLIPVTLALFSLRSSATSAPTSIQAVQLFLFLALSRMGLWIYDLAAQTLVQTRVEANRRGEFSGVEMGFVSACELAQWVGAAILNRPEEFKYLGAASNVVVGLAVAGYTGWIWKQRGHLIHWEKVMGCGC